MASDERSSASAQAAVRIGAGSVPRTLAEAIGTMTDAQLEGLFASRPDLTMPLAEDLSMLALHAASAPSVRRAWLHLTKLERQVVEVLVARQGPASAAELLASMDPTAEGTAASAITAAIQRCRDLALIWGSNDALRVVTSLGQQIGPAPCGLDSTDRSHQPRIAAFLASPQSLFDELSKAPPAARAAVERLLWGPPRGSLPNAQRPVSEATAATPVEWLLAREILVPAGPDTVALPREVALLLRGGRYLRAAALPPGPPVDPASPRVPDADATAGMHALAATRAAASLLTLLEQGSTRVLRTGGVYQRDAALLADRLQLTLGQTALLADALLRAGLIAADPQTGQWALTHTADAWRVLPEPRQWAVLLLAWRDSPAHTASADLEGSEHRILADALQLPGIADVRRVALAVCAETKPGRPVDPALLAEAVSWRAPRHETADLLMLLSAVLRDAEFLGVLGRGALTRAGRHLIDQTPDPSAIADAVAWPSLVDRVVLQADLTATALGPMQPEAEARMARLADVESTGAGTVYRFSSASLQRAFDSGMATAEVAAELADLSMTGVPGTLEALVADVGRRHGAVRVASAASVITSDDDAALAAALADRSLAHLRLHRIAAGVAISHASPEAVTAALRKAGVLAVSAAATAQRPYRLAAAPVTMLSQGLNAAELAAAVRAVRSGQSARAALAGPSRTEALAPHDLADTLRDAIRDGRALWLDFADASGTRRVRHVQPITVRGGVLSGFDQRDHRVAAYPLSRIAGVALVDAPATDDSGAHGKSRTDE